MAYRIIHNVRRRNGRLCSYKIRDWLQAALVIFVISYSTLVTLMFFLFLWLKPENFYGPSEYPSNISSDSYIRAIKGMPEETINAVSNLENNPYDKDSFFKLLDNLIKESEKQHLVLMRKNNNSFFFFANIFMSSSSLSLPVTHYHEINLFF